MYAHADELRDDNAREGRIRDAIKLAIDNFEDAIKLDSTDPWLCADAVLAYSFVEEDDKSLRHLQLAEFAKQTIATRDQRAISNYRRTRFLTMPDHNGAYLMLERFADRLSQSL